MAGFYHEGHKETYRGHKVSLALHPLSDILAKAPYFFVQVPPALAGGNELIYFRLFPFTFCFQLWTFCFQLNSGKSK